jgi:cytochrome c-type biogenesis protein CcmH
VLEFLLALLTTATVAALLVPLLRPRLVATDRLDNDTAVYRDQLAEVERDRAAGTLPDTDAAAARTEIERRLLAAAVKDQAPGARRSDGASWHRFLTPALCLLIPLFALGLYLQIGQPGVPSAPFIARASPAPSPDAQAGRDLAGTLAAARARVAAAPDDPDALSALGEALTYEADGVVTPAARDAFRHALDRSPDDARAMFYLGLHEAQSGDAKAALERWRTLEQRSPPQAPWLPSLRAEMQRVARAAGLPVPQSPAPPTVSGTPSPAPGMPNPTPDQMQAMQGLTPEQRQQAIRGMVEGLDARLRAAPPGKPEDRDGWLRLANARRVLGENDRAIEAYARADALAALPPAQLADWAEAHVRLIKPGAPPPPDAVAVLERLEKAEPRNALALFYLGAASFAQGDKPAAARRWKTLLALLPSDAPIRAMLEGKIKEAE